MKKNYNVVIIGSGPGGHTAAIHAAKSGKSVCIIEKEDIGGVCLNQGCIPSKALLGQAKHFNTISSLEHLNIKIDKSSFQYSKVYEKSKAAVERLRKGLEFTLKKLNIDIIKNTAKLLTPNTVLVGDTQIEAENIILATGSTPLGLPNISFDSEIILSSKEVLNFTSLPNSIAVIGGGVVGLELGYLLNSFGVDVSIFEFMPSILPREDTEIINTLTRVLKKQGIQFICNAKVKSVSHEKERNKALLKYEDKQKNEHEKIIDKVLLAVGRKPNTSDLNITELGLETENEFLKVNEFYQTNISNIYAIGDIVNTPLLAHVASREAEIAVDHICGLNPITLDINFVPSVIYTEPQVASFGYSEQTLKDIKLDYEKKVVQYRSSGKAVATEHYEGMVKILINTKTKAIFGAHIVGAEATEIIHELLIAAQNNLKIDDIKNVIHAHPTLSEMLREVF
jgi:dihydrolipoamide dehydrogenase